MSSAVRALLRNVPTVAHVPHRAVLSVVGSQASEFLNGILASTVHDPPPGPFFSAFLHAQAGTSSDREFSTESNARSVALGESPV